MSIAGTASIRPSDGKSSRPDRKSISSRLGSLFTSKSSHINKLAIELDEDRKTNGIKKYGPGETVSGTVVLDVARPLGVTHVVVCFAGMVEVFKNHEKPRSERSARSKAGTNRGKRWVNEYYGDGFVSLFEDEIILCGEGRLDPKLYHFRFNVDFPKHLGLPSSIEFERGRISYHLTATVTRPAAMAATASCVRHVDFQELIDIGTLPAPKVREATLRPVERTAPSKAQLRGFTSYDSKSYDSKGDTQSSTTPIVEQVATASTEFQLAEPSSPVPISSRNSLASATAGSTAASLPRSSHTSPSRTEAPRTLPTSIHTAVELTRSGCLPGQTIFVLIKVENHFKAIRSIKGVLATLYRESRVDMHPNLPVGIASSAAKRYEDYYPRSKTGLGGLSLSAAGSSQVWRKDLAQTTAPLLIDPQTMSAEVRVPIRVPADVFPSIRRVPGEMISFKYLVEVIIDVQGKLPLQDMAFPALETLSSTPATSVSFSPGVESGGTFNQSQMLAASQRCFDTSAIKRDKHAVVVQCDLVVGTCDSAISDWGQKRTASQRESTLMVLQHERHGFDDRRSQTEDTASHHYTSQLAQPQIWDPGQHQADAGALEGQNHNDHWNQYHGYDGYYYDGYDYGYDEYDHWYYNDQYHSHPQHLANQADGSLLPFPRPPSMQEEGLSEKERMRRAEESLLPSQPPAEAGPSAWTANEDVPSAPVLTEAFGGVSAPQTGAPFTRVDSPQRPLDFDQTPSRPPSVSAADVAAAAMPNMPNMPTEPGTKTTEAASFSDDKQELERHRLAAQASEPEPEATRGGDFAARASAPPPDEVSEEAREERVEEEEEEEEASCVQQAQPDTEPHPAAHECLGNTGEFLPRYER